MKNINLLRIQAFVVLFSVLLISQNSFSQWMLAGSVPNPGVRPSISVVDMNTVWICGGNGDTARVFRTLNGGVNWSSIPVDSIGKELFCLWASDPTTAIVGEGIVNGNARLFRTVNSGANWTVVGQTGNNEGYFNGLAFPRTINEINFGLALAERIFRSTDGGSTWVMIMSGVNGVSNAHNSLFIVDNFFYGFGMNNGAARVRMTTDNGTSWSNRNVGITGNYTSAIAFSDNKMNGIAATSTSMPFLSRTTDGGVSWTQIDVGPGVTGVVKIKWIAYTNYCYLMGENGGIKRSLNGGLTWTNMTTANVTDLYHFDFIAQNNIVYGYAVSKNGTVIKLADSGILTGVNTNEGIPSTYSLGQNYPNPFNPVTTIRYGLPEPSFVRISVHDILGREVEVLVNEYKIAGIYDADWDASKYSSGIYFYKLVTDKYTATKKMVLSK